MNYFKNKVVIVTGASSGIGKATALLFASHGAKVAITYKDNKQGAEEVISQIRQLGSIGIALQTELTNDNQVKNLVSQVISEFGEINVLVNNAGRYVDGDEWDGDINTWELSIKQNFISVLSISKYVIKQMQKQQSGVIVNISSRYSVSGQYDALTYATSKAGIVNLTQGQARLMAPWGRSNAVSPGAVKAVYWLIATQDEIDQNIVTIPLQKLIDPEDIANAVVFLASNKAQMITGQNLIVDGGYTLR